VNGSKFLLDTNIIIGLFKGYPAVLSILQDHAVELDMCAYSFITRIELLGYPGITEAEAQDINRILQIMRYLPMTQSIEDMTIQLRQRYSLKIPDAIIAATARVTGGLSRVSFDTLTLPCSKSVQTGKLL